ncbi:MAG: hypothetical protein ACNA8W_18970, partial [Bradymonadaceae bacterium]
ISMLPEFWQGVSHLNPILYMVNAFRYGLLGVTDINLWLSYAIILAFIAAPTIGVGSRSSRTSPLSARMPAKSSG